MEQRAATATRSLREGRSTSLAFHVEMPEFSDAAWRNTLVAEAASRLEFEWVKLSPLFHRME